MLGSKCHVEFVARADTFALEEAAENSGRALIRGGADAAPDVAEISDGVAGCVTSMNQIRGH